MATTSRRKYEEWRAYAISARSVSNEQMAALAFEPMPDDAALMIDFALVRFAAIDAQALAQFDEWASTLDFPWHTSPTVIRADSRHLDLSLWYGDTLCGLCFASPSNKRTLVRIKLLEGKPRQGGQPHPLKGKVLELCLFAVNQYCKIIDAREIVIDQPLEGAVRSYLENGFEMRDGVLVLSLDA